MPAEYFQRHVPRTGVPRFQHFEEQQTEAQLKQWRKCLLWQTAASRKTEGASPYKGRPRTSGVQKCLCSGEYTEFHGIIQQAKVTGRPRAAGSRRAGPFRPGKNSALLESLGPYGLEPLREEQTTPSEWTDTPARVGAPRIIAHGPRRAVAAVKVVSSPSWCGHVGAAA
jgi:hypothetical protein